MFYKIGVKTVCCILIFIFVDRRRDHTQFYFQPGTQLTMLKYGDLVQIMVLRKSAVTYL
jgi:hypothetical protein